MRVIRCPNSAVTVSYQENKTTVSNTVVETSILMPESPEPAK